MDSRFPGNKIHKTAIIYDNIKMGKGNTIMPYAIIGEAGFIRKGENPEGTVVIGDNNTIGCYVNVMIGTSGETTIGDDNLIMNHSNIGHNTFIGNDNEVGAGTILNGYAIINHGIKIKSGCVIRNRIEISSGIIIGQGSNVVNDLKDAGLYYGNPAK